VNPAYTAAQMWVRNLSGDQGWQTHVSTLDEDVLRHLAALLRIEERTTKSRRGFVEILLDLLPAHECNCDKRWTSDDVPHAADCERLKACTCYRQWSGPALHINDHSPDCELMRRWIPARPTMPDNYDDEETIVP